MGEGDPDGKHQAGIASATFHKFRSAHPRATIPCEPLMIARQADRRTAKRTFRLPFGQRLGPRSMPALPLWRQRPQAGASGAHAKSTMHGSKWVVLIARSTGSALRAVRPPNLHITPVVRRDLVYAASAVGSLYRSPLTIMAQTMRAILLASAMAATLVGRRPIS
jgi:hypothetical protein